MQTVQRPFPMQLHQKEKSTKEVVTGRFVEASHQVWGLWPTTKKTTFKRLLEAWFWGWRCEWEIPSWYGTGAGAVGLCPICYWTSWASSLVQQQQPSSPSFKSSDLLRRVQEGKGESQYLQETKIFLSTSSSRTVSWSSLRASLLSRLPLKWVLLFRFIPIMSWWQHYSLTRAMRRSAVAFSREHLNNRFRTMAALSSNCHSYGQQETSWI